MGSRARLALLVAAVVLSAVLATVVARMKNPYVDALDTWGLASLEMLFGLVCLGRYWDRYWRGSRQEIRGIPIALGAACLSWGSGDLLSAVLHGGQGVAGPSPIDVFYFGFYALAYLSLMTLLRPGGASSLLKTALDGLMAALLAAAFTAAYLFGGVKRSAGGTDLATAMKLAYPVGDVLLFLLALGATLLLPRRHRRFLAIFAIGTCVHASGQLYALVHPPGRLAHLAGVMTSPLALLAVAVAVWALPSDVDKVESDKAGGFTLPVVGAGASMIILYTASLGHASSAATGFATGTLLVAIVRLAIIVREGQALKTARFRSLIDKAWDLIVVAEVDFEIAFVTPSAERMLGYLPSQMQGRPLTEQFHPDDVDVVTALLSRLAEDGTETATFEARVRNSDGAWRIVSWAATNLLSDPSVGGYVLNGSDVTEVRRASDDLAAARDGALMASKAKSEFLSIMSHEIRTPMNGVIGLTELLLSTDLEDEQRELASGISVSAETLLGIINDILDFSKIEAGKMDLDESSLDLGQMLDDIGRILATAAHKKGLELIIDIAADVPSALLGDAVRLQQVLLNLGSNAVKFTYEGEVVIRVVVLHEDGERVALRFEVIDQGIGIAAEDQQRLFRAFAQADSSTTRRFGGTGLGLAISRQLVELMGGELGLISSAGEGSTFWFEVSLRRGEAQVPAMSDPGLDASIIFGQRALIIDDNATNRRILRQQLTSWGVVTVEATDAYDALRLATAAVESGEPFDLGVVDLNMPGMDGIELARILKSDPATAGATLFLLSSSGQRLGAAEAHLRGFADSLTKPVRSSELYDCLISNSHPRNPAPSADTGPHEIEGEIPTMPGVILLVEDNKMNQLVASKVLSKLGYGYDIANDGREAVGAIRTKSYDAVLMDCQMPYMDGYRATELIRSIEGTSRHTPIIAMTAAAMEGDRETCLEAGMDDYISKPVRPEAIADALSRWISRGPDAAVEDLAATGEPEEPEPVDGGQLDVLRSLDDGDGSLLEEIVGQFLAQTAQGHREMVRDLTRGDTEGVARTAHSVKGASANVGATALAGVCSQIELSCRNAPLPATATLLDRFGAEFSRAREALLLLTDGVSR